MTPDVDPPDVTALRADNARLRATVDELLGVVADLRAAVAKQQAHIDRLVRLTVPYRIVIAVVAEFPLYGFSPRDGSFPEFPRILEDTVTRGPPVARAGTVVDICGGSSAGGSRRRPAGFVPGEPPFEDRDGRPEVVAGGEQQVEVVDVRVTGEAVGQVVPRVDGGEHLAAAGAQEDEPAVAGLRRRAVPAEGGDRHRHRQVVAEAA
jgi:hypothetical protein